jgi:hypothetical protein
MPNESEALRVALQGAEAIQLLFESPDDDWEPMLFLENAKQEVAIVQLGPYFENDTKKHLFLEAILPDLVRKTEVQRLVMVLSAYGLEMDKEQAAEYMTNAEPTPRNHPDRFEILIVTEMTAEGVINERHAFINRDPLKRELPRLGEFQAMPKDANFESEWIDNVVDALREVRA